MLCQAVYRGLLVAVCWSSVSVGWGAGEAQRAFEQAHARVVAGDLAAARKLLVTAVKREADNQRYLQQYLLVSQAIKLEQAVARESDPRRWESAAQSLSLFYKMQGVPARALPIDEAIYQRLKSTDAAVQYCETLLELDQCERVVELLGQLRSSEATASSGALLSIALARQDQLEEAKRIAGGLQLPSGTDAFTLYMAARAQAAVGAVESALATLRRCFESVPPSRLAPLKSHTRQCREFAAFASRPAFSDVLRTESKVPESKCSGGSSCGSCPLRGQCSHDQ